MGLVTDRLAGSEPVLDKGDVTVLDAVLRSWRDPEHPDRDAIGAEMAELLSSEDNRLRAAACVFFRTFGEAPDAGRLFEAITNTPEAFDGVENPWTQEAADLRGLVAAALAARLPAAGEAVRRWVQAEALAPGRGSTKVLAGLTRAEPDWVHEHAGEIATANPKTLPLLVTLLQRAGRLDAEVVQRLAEIDSSEVLAALERFPGDGPERALLAELRSGA